LIFVDGPVGAMEYDAIRAITGMQGRGKYFQDERMLLAVGESELVPNSGQTIDLQARQKAISQWNAFREKSVSALVQDVYQRVKQVKPEVQVSAAVYRKKSWAVNVFQDWYAWLSDGYIDFVVPMAYVSETSSLERLVDEWQADGVLDQIVVGLAVADFDDQDNTLKVPKQVLEEIELLQNRGISRIVVFDDEHISDEQSEALATGPFAPAKRD
jgi:uncharacterized lipoprotein YddW (UPF0748 family)